MERKNAWKEYTEAENSELEKLNESYRKFLDAGKTERECVKQAVAMAEAAGYLDLKKVIEEGKKVKAGDKLYAVNMKKSLALFQIGKQPLEKGMAILGAHIDSPRLDIKQNPLYEDTELAYLDTHYYGGIKKYQWVTLPLAIHGVIAKKDGTIVDVCIGEDENDPVVGISDLLIHLSADQLDKKAAKVIEGLEVNSTFKNCVVVGGTYIGVTVEDKDCTPTTVYENKVEINKTAAEDNQYTGDKAGDKLSNITFDIFNAETDEKFGTINIQNGYGELKYLPIGKWYAVETSKNDYYIFPENNRFDFEITQKGQTVVLDIENDVVNLIVDVEKTGTVETEPGKDITYNFDIQNKSNDTVTNFIWGDILPSEVRAKSITTGTFNKDNTYKVQYITNNNSNWKTIKTCNTNESSEILLDSNTLELAENEYVTEVRFVFENPVEKGFKNEGTKIIVTANDDLQNNQIIENHTYITADYLDVKLDDEDEFHTIIRIPEPEKPKTLPRTGK